MLLRLFGACVLCLGLVSPAAAQDPKPSPPPAQVTVDVAEPSPLAKFAVDVVLGFEPTLNGSINTGAIGTLEDHAAVILPNSYADVYGSGFHLRLGVGYKRTPTTEIRGTFTWQSADADLTRMGDIGVSNLYGQYDDWKSWAFDVGLRKYVVPRPVAGAYPAIRPFVEGSIGVAWVSEIGVVLAAPSVNDSQNVGKFYEGSTGFAYGASGGVLISVLKRTDLTAQIGLRHVSGLSEVDKLGTGTGFDTINTDSARWSLPILVGVRQRF